MDEVITDVKSNINRIKRINGIEFIAGGKVEAKDALGEKWWTAKILDVDPEAAEVLVHFIKWNARHDEWIKMDSPRLRPCSENNGSSPRAPTPPIDENATTPSVTPSPSSSQQQSAKDFKGGDRVIASWKYGRRYPATILHYEAEAGTFLIVFDDGVKHSVRPNNIRRFRPGDDDQIMTNGGNIADVESDLDGGGTAVQQSPETIDDTDAGGLRRERKQKFNVRELLNIRTAQQNKKMASSKSDDDGDNTKDKRRASVRVNDKHKVKSPGAVATPDSNGDHVKVTKEPLLKEGNVTVSGKRERKRKKFWDEQDTPPSKVNRQNEKKLKTPSSRERKLSGASHPDLKDKRGKAKVNCVQDKEVVETVCGKENGKTLKYLLLDLSDDPATVAKQMVEGENIPGPGVPIPVDSSSLPNGWEKRVIQRGLGVTKGKWDVFILSPTGKSFRSKTDLQRHFEEKKLPYSIESFDFSLDDNLKKLRQIWKQYVVKPKMLKDNHGPPRSSASATPVKRKDPPPPRPPAPQPPANEAVADRIPSPLSETVIIGTESETGQGVRCPIDKCRKLFRSDKLLQMHAKHYHPEVHDATSTPSVPEMAYARTVDHRPTVSPTTPPLIENSGGGKKRKNSLTLPSEESRKTNLHSFRSLDESTAVMKSRLKDALVSEPKNRKKTAAATAASFLTHRKDHDDPEPTSGRTRNDSILSVGSEASSTVFRSNASVTSDGEDLDHPSRVPCPLTPPTYRVSKRRQAQLKKKVTPIIRVNRIDETSEGKGYMEEYMSFLSVKTPAASDDGGSVSYPASEMDASVTSEHLTSEEVVNCMCGRREEDGLMIQCDICLCWQHGYCLDVEEDKIPDKHICQTCKEPRGGRPTAKFSIDQDWLKEGRLLDIPCSIRTQESEASFRKLSDLMADLSNLNKVLHSLRVKLHVASQSNNSKVFMWSSVWENTLQAETPPEANEESKPAPPFAHEDSTVAPHGDKDCPPASELTPPDSISEAESKEVPKSGIDGIEDIPANMIPTVSEVQRLLPSIIQASLAGELGGGSNPGPPPPAAPEWNPVMMPENPVLIPEPKRLDRDECRLNLLQHVEALQEQVMAKLDQVENHLIDVESGKKSPSEVNGVDNLKAKTKTIILMLLQDLHTSKKMVGAL